MSSEKFTARLRTERDLSDGEGHVQVYEVGRYLVIIRGDRKSTGKHIHVEIRYGDNHYERAAKEESYLPCLYTHGCFDDEGNACHVDIGVSTTSYGTFSLDKMERYMQEMQEGVDTAKYIGETFIKPMVEGKWNWEVTV